jgi:hypothetical protein
MRVAGGCQVATQALARGLTQVGILVQECFGIRCPVFTGVPQVSSLSFGLAHQRDEDFALAPALTAKAPHDLLEGLVQRMSGGLQSRGRDRALLTDALDEGQDFFSMAR